MDKIEKIAINSHDRVLYVNLYEILYCQSENTFVTIHLLSGVKHVVYKQLKKVQQDLPSNFVRISQCVVINKLFVDCIDKREKKIIMNGNTEIPYTMGIRSLLDRIGTISSENITAGGINADEEDEVVDVFSRSVAGWR